jgi:hypothetical protein
LIKTIKKPLIDRAKRFLSHRFGLGKKCIRMNFKGPMGRLNCANTANTHLFGEFKERVIALICSCCAVGKAGEGMVQA